MIGFIMKTVIPEVKGELNSGINCFFTDVSCGHIASFVHVLEHFGFVDDNPHGVHDMALSAAHVA